VMLYQLSYFRFVAGLNLARAATSYKRPPNRLLGEKTRWRSMK
jgi:hypothetical protein